MKILYCKGYKWSQNQRVRNDYFGYRWHEALAKHLFYNFLRNIFRMNTLFPGFLFLFSEFHFNKLINQKIVPKA